MIEGVSIIICSYNSAKRLEQTLSHLQNQVFSKKINWEVILVNNASTDGTPSFANKIWNKKPVTPLRVVEEPSPGLMNARKKGVHSANFSLVSFVDDDNWVEQHWIEKVYDFFSENRDITACGGFSEAVISGDRPYWFDLIASVYAVGPQMKKPGLMANANECLWGAGFSVRTEIIRRLFDKDFEFLHGGRKGKELGSGDDSEICLILKLKGYKLWYNENMKLQHEIPPFRLSRPYAKRIMQSMGSAELTLSIYRHTLDPKYKIYKSLILELAAQIKYIPGLLFHLLFSSRDKRFLSFMYIIFRLSYMKELINQKTERKELFLRINKLQKL